MPTEAEIWQAMHGAIPGARVGTRADIPRGRGRPRRLQADRDRRAALNRLAQASVPGRVPRPWPYKVSRIALAPAAPGPAAVSRVLLAPAVLYLPEVTPCHSS